MPNRSPITPEVRDLLAIIRTEADAVTTLVGTTEPAVCAATILDAARRLAYVLDALDTCSRITHHNGRLTDRYTASGDPTAEHGAAASGEQPAEDDPREVDARACATRPASVTRPVGVTPHTVTRAIDAHPSRTLTAAERAALLDALTNVSYSIGVAALYAVMSVSEVTVTAPCEHQLAGAWLCDCITDPTEALAVTR